MGVEWATDKTASLIQHEDYAVPVVVQDSGIGAIALAVYNVLLRFQDASGECSPDFGLIGEILGGVPINPNEVRVPVSRPTITRAIKRLEIFGLLTVTRSKTPNGKRRTNLYHILPVTAVPVPRGKVPVTAHDQQVVFTPSNRGGNFRRLVERDGERCQAPGCEQCTGLTVDHIVSRKDGGTSDLDNLHLLCQKHNSEKGPRSWEWFLNRYQQVRS